MMTTQVLYRGRIATTAGGVRGLLPMFTAVFA